MQLVAGLLGTYQDHFVSDLDFSSRTPQNPLRTYHQVSDPATNFRPPGNTANTDRAEDALAPVLVVLVTRGTVPSGNSVSKGVSM